MQAPPSSKVHHRSATISASLSDIRNPSENRKPQLDSSSSSSLRATHSFGQEDFQQLKLLRNRDCQSRPRTDSRDASQQFTESTSSFDNESFGKSSTIDGGTLSIEQLKTLSLTAEPTVKKSLKGEILEALDNRVPDSKVNQRRQRSLSAIRRMWPKQKAKQQYRSERKEAAKQTKNMPTERTNEESPSALPEVPLQKDKMRKKKPIGFKEDTKKIKAELKARKKEKTLSPNTITRNL